MGKIPGLAAIKKTIIPIILSKTGRNFLYSILVMLKIIISIEKGKNTEPKYEIRLAIKAPVRLFETEIRKYPKLTTKTEKIKTKYQNFFL